MIVQADALRESSASTGGPRCLHSRTRGTITVVPPDRFPTALVWILLILPV